MYASKLRSVPTKNCIGIFRIVCCVAASHRSCSNEVRNNAPPVDRVLQLPVKKEARECLELVFCLKQLNQVLKTPAADTNSQLVKIGTLDRLVEEISNCKAGDLDQFINPGEYENVMRMLIMFNAKREQTSHLRKARQRLAVAGLKVLCSQSVSSALRIFPVTCHLLHWEDMFTYNSPIVIHVRAYLHFLLEIIKAVPPDFNMCLPLTRMTIFLSNVTLEDRNFKENQGISYYKLRSAVHVTLCQLGRTIRNYDIQAVFYDATILPRLFVLLPLIGVSDKDVLNGFEKFLCEIASTRAGAYDWAAWSANVLYAFSHAGVPAPRLASWLAELVDREKSQPRKTETIIRNRSITLRLSWAFISQGLLPPAQVLHDLHSLVSCFIVRSCPISKISWHVNLLPQILPFLEEPFPYRNDLIHLMYNAIGERNRNSPGLYLKAQFPDMLVNLVFPHEGAVLAAGVFDSGTGRLLRYPSYAPSPEVIDNGAIPVILGRRCVLVIDVERSSSLLHPGNYMSGRHERQRWLLERKGWPVCVVKGDDHSPEDLLRIMQMKARLDRLRSLNGVD